ncbi:MAG: excinuclease ABC subunit UvrA [Clostridia bacterium]|nr:excinuclease ABC subunit UvrA [Clostridia bacterium]
MKNSIIVKGAKENNLKNVSLEIPRDKFVVFTGVSGSGKSSLAFGTIFAEGQRRYIESLSSYARQFLGAAQKPDVEVIEGLSPAISIDQKTTNRNPRSTVGTVTEIYDYLRLLFARVGTPYCPHCNREVKQQTIDQIVDAIKELGEGAKITVMAPVVRGQKGRHEKLLASLKRSGYVRVEVDGAIFTLDETITLDKNLKHDISVVVDRIVLKGGKDTRLSGSLETALKIADGLVIVENDGKRELYSTNYACTECGWTLEEISPRLFSFNAPYGACPHCLGLGYTMDIDEGVVLKNSHLSINDGAFSLTGWRMEEGSMAKAYFVALSKQYDIDLSVPVKELPKDKIKILLYGSGNDKIDVEVDNERGKHMLSVNFEGIVNNLRRRYKETTSEFIKFEIGRFMREQACSVCHGKRLNESALSVKINKKDIVEYCDNSIKNLIPIFENLELGKVNAQIAEPILKEVNARLNFLKDVGLAYLTLNRSAESLSGGEAQRIRLATQIGSGLVGVLYILDEPSIGLHQRDNEKLLGTLQKLKSLGNTLIVVEHDEDTIRAADYLVDVGPYAGIHGGEIVAAGTVEQVMKSKNSITAKFLRGEEKIEIPTERRKPKDFLTVVGAKQNNLKNINVKIPTGILTLVTGVSGSGKSSLVNGILYPYLSNLLNNSKLELGNFKEIKNAEVLDKVINIDQAPIGRTPRSNPATYTGVFTAIRDLFASTPDANARGFASGRFSFNIKGGRCEACEGAGVKEIEMYFLPDITVPCEVCRGKRYNRETLEVKYKGKTISDVLDMTVEEALKFFENLPSIKNKIQALYDVGLSYIKLGQPATTLSGGEAQRVKLATELSRKDTGKTMYILDEPTTGLHMYDVKKLIAILQRLIGNGNSVVVIEHNLDVIKCADYIIDIGPEGGDEGGTVIAAGTPEEIANCTESHTGRFLKRVLEGGATFSPTKPLSTGNIN